MRRREGRRGETNTSSWDPLRCELLMVDWKLKRDKGRSIERGDGEG